VQFIAFNISGEELTLLAGNPSGTPFRAMSYVDFVTPMLRSKIVCLGARQKHPNKARVYSRDSMKDA
jgi:hypothetical protein